MNLKLFKLFLGCLVLKIANGYLFEYINEQWVHFENITQNDLEKFSVNEQVLIAVIFGPVFETLILQMGLYVILKDGIKIKNDHVVIGIMSTVFAMSHYYHWIYVIATFFGGVILNYFFIESKKLTRGYFFYTYLLHALYNLYPIAIDRY